MGKRPDYGMIGAFKMRDRGFGEVGIHTDERVSECVR